MPQPEKLHELRHRRSEIKAKIAAFLKQEEDRPAEEPTPQEDVDEYEALKVALAELDGRIARIEEMLAADANGEGDGNGGEGGGDGEAAFHPPAEILPPLIRSGNLRVPATVAARPAEGKGFRLARYMIGVAWAKWYGPEVAAQRSFNRFRDDKVAGAIKALNTGVVAEGGALIPQDFMNDLIELLRAATVIRAAGPMIVGMPLGNLTLPRLAGGASSVYQGEMDDISLTEEVFDDLNLVAKKLTAMVPVSNDLLRRAPINVETVVRDDLVASVARKEDVSFIRSDGTGKSPIGFRSLVLPANLLVIPAGGNLDAVVAAIAAMKLALVNGLSRMLKPAWVMPPTIVEFIRTRRDAQGGFYYKDEIDAGTLDGFPIFQTPQIPTNLGAGHGSEFYLADFADVVIADVMNAIVDASDQAAYYGTDNAVVSTFQRDQTLFRIIAEHDFGMRHLQSLAVATTTDWLFTGLAGAPGRPWSTQPLNRTWAQAPAAWPADANAAASPPTLYDPATALTSAFDGLLTDNPGGGPYPIPLGMTEDPNATGASGTTTGAGGPAGEGSPPTPPTRPRGGGGSGGGSSASR